MFRPPASVLLALQLVSAGCASRAQEPAPDTSARAISSDGSIELPQAQRRYLTVEPAKKGEGRLVLTVPAHVAFKDGAQSQLGAPLSGRVLQVHVRTGDAVKPGDPLVTLDCPEAAAVRTALATATAAEKEARAAMQRERQLLERGVGVERDVLAAETHLAEAEAETARARASSAFVGAGSGTTVTLRAPIAGTVLTRHATVGAAVQPGGEPLVEIGDPGALWVVAEVPERDVAGVREGALATVDLPSSKAPLSGKVASVGAVVQSAMRSAPVRIELDAGAAGVRPGMYGRARISQDADGVTLPTEAVLIRDGKETVVYVESKPQHFERRPVVVAPPAEGRVQVLSGLEAGDPVVVKGALLLDGAADQLL